MKIIYQADDGNQFSSKKDCEQYEINSIQLKDVVAGAKFIYGETITTIIETYSGKFWMGGLEGNPFKSYSNFKDTNGGTQQEVLDHLKRYYRKVIN